MGVGFGQKGAVDAVRGVEGAAVGKEIDVLLIRHGEEEWRHGI